MNRLFRPAARPLTTPRQVRLSFAGTALLTIAGLSLGVSGCGGGSSERPNFAQSVGYEGTYLGSVNRSASGTATNSTLPSGTVSFVVNTGGTLTATLNLVDTTRAASSRSVTTEGDLTGTYNSNGTFDITGRPNERDNRNNIDVSYTIGGRTTRLQGQLPASGATTSLTVQIGDKTTTGTITQTFSGTPTPSPSALPSTPTS